jgi:hypothetical protein
MRPYYMIEKSPRNRELYSEGEKAKNQYMFHTINGRDGRCRMNMPMIDVPKKAVSLTFYELYGLHYPRLFLLRRSQLIPVVLQTEYVGQHAYNSMVNAGRLVPVPPGSEGVAESLELLFIKYYSKASLLVPVLFNICDSSNGSYDPDNAYNLCLLFLVKDFVGDHMFGTPASRMQFKEDAAAQIMEWKEGGVLQFAEMGSIIFDWCNTHYELYEDNSGSDVTY